MVETEEKTRLFFYSDCRYAFNGNSVAVSASIYLFILLSIWKVLLNVKQKYSNIVPWLEKNKISHQIYNWIDR